MDQAALERIPAAPGVYLMKDAGGKVLYVGKARQLRARVRSYFRPGGGDERPFVASGLLGRLVADIEAFVVGNEKEALLLENNLIKEHRPRFNVKLIDDKNYLVLRIDRKASYPRVEVVRGIADDGARYFGPYHSASSARETLKLVNRHFQLRTCTDHVLRTRTRPCVLFQIKRCPAPCVLPIPKERYAAQVEDAILLLDGKNDDLLPRLRARMGELSEGLAFERAAQLRDQIAAVETSLERQIVVQEQAVDQDVIGFHRRDDRVELMVLFVRGGKLLGRRAFALRGQAAPDAELLRRFVVEYYDLGATVPGEVLLPCAVDGAAAIGEWLHAKSGRRARVLHPQRGARLRLLELARKNAEASFIARGEQQEDLLTTLEKLGHSLGLARAPRRIECWDVAHLQGTFTVAAMVVFVDGVPQRGEHRRLRVRTAGNDDFASLYEVLMRRFRRLREGDASFPAPDLCVIDGGKGQLGVALAARRDSGLPERGEGAFEIIALAKERSLEGGGVETDRVFLPNAKDPLRLRPGSAELLLLARVRDEAHRVANTYHRNVRTRRTIRSVLDDVPGIGPARRRALLTHFGSVERIRAAPLDQLLATPGMTRSSALAVHRALAGGGVP
ncbi:MAG: excinuclease ABC subunit UvrC [Myxococcales bacterium]|nr:excinuclease ABC subunit UvrC [Myxococcales bacterium]